jgi:hypothetical protein
MRSVSARVEKKKAKPLLTVPPKYYQERSFVDGRRYLVTVN